MVELNECAAKEILMLVRARYRELEMQARGGYSWTAAQVADRQAEAMLLLSIRDAVKEAAHIELFPIVLSEEHVYRRKPEASHART